MTEDTALTDTEFEALRDAGWKPTGGGIKDGRAFLRFTRNGEQRTASRAEWRGVIAELNKPLTEDELAFGRDAWIYCSQHMRPHETGWCGVGIRDKVGLGVGGAEAAYEKCRAWKFPLYGETENTEQERL